MVGQSEIRKSIERGTRTGQQDLFQGSSAHKISRLVPPGGAAAARSASPRTPGLSPPSLSSRGTATLDTDAIAAAMAGTGCNGDRSAAGTVQPETCVSDYQGTGTSYRSTPSYSRSPRHTATEKPKKKHADGTCDGSASDTVNLVLGIVRKDNAAHVVPVTAAQIEQIQKLLGGGHLSLCVPTEQATSAAAPGFGQRKLRAVRRLMESELPSLKKSFRKKSKAQKQTLLMGTAGLTINQAAKATGGVACKNSIKRMRKPRKLKQTGPKPDEAFEIAVRDELIYQECVKIDDKEKLVTVANVCYSYAVIKMAARYVQKTPQFVNNAVVQKIGSGKNGISNGWVKKWLNRQVLRRRRVTATEKVLLPPQEVQSHMLRLQQKLRGQAVGDADDEIVLKGPFPPSHTWSADETAMMFGAQPKNQYVGEDSRRGSVPDSDDKARFTSMQMGNGKGKMAASFNIIKCSYS